MAKNKVVKKITTDKLATMIAKGFSGQDKRFDKIENDVGELKINVNDIKKDVKEIKNDLKEVVNRTDKVESRVDYMENILNIPSKRH